MKRKGGKKGQRKGKRQQPFKEKEIEMAINEKGLNSLELKKMQIKSTLR